MPHRARPTVAVIRSLPSAGRRDVPGPAILLSDQTVQEGWLARKPALLVPHECIDDLGRT